MSDEHEILKEIKELRSDLSQFKVEITQTVTATATNVDHLEKEKVQLFTFANESKDAIGMLRGAGIAISFAIMVGGFFLAYMTYQNSLIKPDKARIISEKRELDN